MKVHVPHDVVKDGEYAITDHINDHISDETGWLHHGYDMKRVKGKTRKESVDATSAADDFLNELSQEFGAENITLDTIMENISELETLLTSLKDYFGIDEDHTPVTILSAEEQASTDDPYEQHAMAVQKLKDIINKERNEETKTKESNNGN